MGTRRQIQMEPRKLNLMHTALDLDIGGLQRLIADITPAMNRERFNIEVCCFNRLGCFADQLQEEGVGVTLLQKNQDHFDTAYPFRLAAFLRSKKVDIIHMHSGSFFFGSLAATMAMIPASVYTEHGRHVPEPRVQLIEDRISGFLVGQIVAVSQELEIYLAERVKLPARKICTIINGIQNERYSLRPKPSHLLKEFNLRPESKVVGTVARLDDVKDQLTMIDAFARVVKAIPEARLFLVGDGPMRQKLNERIDKHRLEKEIFITGARGDIPEMLNLFDLYTLTSVSEGTSLSLLEAMASGLPSVVTNVGGNPSIIKNESEGLLVEPKDVGGIADAMIRVLTNSSLSQELSKKALSKVRSAYSIKSMVKSYENVYFNLLSKKKRYKNLIS